MKAVDFFALTRAAAIRILACDYHELAPLVAERANAIDDGGSCNRDFCYVCFGDRRSKRFEEATGGSWFRYRHTRGYEFVVPGVKGQGARLAFAAAELARLLCERGHDARVYYQVD